MAKAEVEAPALAQAAKVAAAAQAATAKAQANNQSQPAPGVPGQQQQPAGVAHDAVLLPNVVQPAVDAEWRHYLQHLVRQQLSFELGTADDLPLPAAVALQVAFVVDEASCLEPAQHTRDRGERQLFDRQSQAR